MKIGTYYYPEQWPGEQWKRDFDHMAEMGMQIVHMGEFAWFTMEPRPGEIQLDWLNECVEMAAARKMSVILCTPTAAPPIWLIEQHPEILPLDDAGRKQRPGGRRHYNPLAPALHDATRRIVTALADRFGNHPSIIGWQIDNEFSNVFDQSDITHAAFREWLKRKYESIDRLNDAWGLRFWNQYFTDWHQIQLWPERDVHYNNPHLALDSSRFWSWAFANYARLQAEILKPRVGSRWITTNFMPFHLDCDPGDMAEFLDLMSWDSYPITGWAKNPPDETYRLGDPASISFTHDNMASYRNRWGLLELQPGHVNWSGFPVLPYPGTVRLWIWTAFAHGAEFVTTYRFRQPRFGVELFHDGLVGTDGVTPSPGGRQFMQVIDELKLLDLTKIPDGVREPGGPAAGQDDFDPATTIGLVFDFEQMWYYATLPQAKRWHQPHWLTLWYAAAARLGLRVKILHPKKAWPQNLAMIVVPGMQMVDPGDVKQLHDYAAAGGHLVLTCRTALMDRTGQLHDGHWAQPILDLICAEIEAYDSLPSNTWGQVELDGKKFSWGVWGDLLYANPDTRVLARYADQFYAGAAAVTQCKYQGGTVTYCGVHGEQPFCDALMERLAAQSNLRLVPLPPRVQLVRRGPYRILLNYQDIPATAPAPANARFLVGTRQVEPAGVAVWEQAVEAAPEPATEPPKRRRRFGGT
ncbi:MAG TPA: beta-galactosidase [Tepidisphaeraceae bacterium]|jgi:beta-galactosidase